VRSPAIYALSLLAFGGLLPFACTQNFNVFETTGANGGSSGSTSTHVSSSAGGATCTSETECDDLNPCTTDTCDAATHMCAHAPIDGAEPGFTDTVKDCKTETCVAGVKKTVDLDTDVPDNTNPCVTPGCSGGMPTTTNMPADTMCGTNPPQKCDDMGNCVGCVQDNDCPDPGTDCKTRTCSAQHVCGTTDVTAHTGCNTMNGKFCDGAGSCVPCTMDQDCTANPSDICNNHQCASSCGDGNKDGKETDKDCGGPCNGCGTGKMCGTGADCTSGKCTGGTCAAPSCSDSVKNQGETDTDCGGPCNGCADGKMCGNSGDCANNHCSGGVCISCMDNKKNGVESDIDCGGTGTTACAKCGDGKTCGQTGDCASNRCFMNVCISCSDNMKNGSETDVDCGGVCPGCVNGKACMANADCTSAHCVGNLCESALCFNLMKDTGNGETDVDCGGANCAKCGDNKACGVDGDCSSNHCVGSVCIPATCFNTTKDVGNGETDVDCGGLVCPARCGSMKGCLLTTDCASGLSCMASLKCM
jgi:hypothetical protein